MIASPLLGPLPPLLDHLPQDTHHMAILTDTTVASLYGNALLDSLSSTTIPTILLSIPPGEKNKTRATKNALEDSLLAQGLGKDLCILALGGGVVLDVAGYVASTYYRGVPFLSIPTTLLAMVDACLGGKTGVNTPQGKNLIGTFYPPYRIFQDPDFLRTLPPQEMRQGIVETIKHALLASPSLFTFLEENLSFFSCYEPSLFSWVIAASSAVKLRIVAADPREDLGLRHQLNFGHTIGHLLENLSAYTLSHGDAVAWGMLAEGFLSWQLAGLPRSSFDRIITLISRLYPSLPPLPPYELSWIEPLGYDKKCRQQQVRCALLHDIGQPHQQGIPSVVDAANIQQAKEFLYALHQSPRS